VSFGFGASATRATANAKVPVEEEKTLRSNKKSNTASQLTSGGTWKPSIVLFLRRSLLP
jgi:hypothetical protein